MSEISQSAQKQIIKNRIKRRRRCDRISTVVMRANYREER